MVWFEGQELEPKLNWIGPISRGFVDILFFIESASNFSRMLQKMQSLHHATMSSADNAYMIECQMMTMLAVQIQNVRLL